VLSNRYASDKHPAVGHHVDEAFKTFLAASLRDGGKVSQSCMIPTGRSIAHAIMWKVVPQRQWEGGAWLLGARQRIYS